MKILTQYLTVAFTVPLTVPLTVPFTTEVGPSPSNIEKTKRAARNIQTKYVTSTTWWKKLLKCTFPIVQTVRQYKCEYVIGDLSAGLSVGIASIPMGESVALLLLRQLEQIEAKLLV